ncbi:hypothetical protein DSO57_1010861 [Entomophthora muscae]|uniref:Uncharacterized protein n=1 Tax=Entomophthora muscae TaxID=34485 RepID=A0ACC2TTQ1_9FUNG|nr:hypothetical protein DSO57_1010861 [Entomophthora muscae]
MPSHAALKLKETSRKIIKAVQSNTDEQNKILQDLEHLAFEDKELKRSASGRALSESSSKKEIGIKGLSPKEVSINAAIDNINDDLLLSFSAFQTPSSFILKCLQYLAPALGPDRFFLKWWPECVKK